MVNYNLDYIKNENGRNEIRKFIKDYKRDEPLKVLSIENGTILPQKKADSTLYPNAHMGLGGVLDAAGNFVEMSGIKSLYSEDLVFGGKYDFYGSVDECDEDVLYMGVFQPHWGHFLMEYCTRLWYSLQNENKYIIAYCGYNCNSGSISGSFKEFFELLGINMEQLIDIRKPTKFHKIIIPEQSFLRNQYYTDMYKYIIDTAYENVNKDKLVPSEKIYFSRKWFIKKNKTNKEHGEQEIQDTLQKNEFEILDPENLSVGEQMFYVRTCNEFAVIPGGASANAVFAADKTKRIYIRKAFITIPDMFQIDQMTDASEVTFIDCYYEPYKTYPINYGGGPHFIGYTKEFEMFLKSNNMEPLSKGIYYRALMKTYVWLTQIAICEFYFKYKNKYMDKKYYYKIQNVVDKLISHGVKNFIIYPYGKMGSIAKEILDARGIDNYILVDHYKWLTDKMIYDIDVLCDDKYFDYILLLCSDKKNVHHEAVKSIAHDRLSDKKRIIEIF